MTENQPKSNFVTVLAWIFIVLSGLGTVISILQNIMIQTVFSNPEVIQEMHSSPMPPGAPPFMAFLVGHFQLFFLAFLFVSLFALISSIGLLRRWNWARICFIGLMAIAIIWQLGGIAIQFSMMSSMQQQFSSAAVEGGPDMRPFFVAICIVSVLFALGFSSLFAWITKKLLSAPIAAEFRG